MIEEENRKPDKQGRHKIILAAFVLPLGFLYIEWLFQFLAFSKEIQTNFQTLFFALPMFALLSGFLLSGIYCWLPDKLNRIMIAVSLGIHTLIACVQVVYMRIFSGEMFRWNTLGFGGDAIVDFGKSALTPIFHNLPAIIFLSLPFILFIIFNKKYYLPASRHTRWQALSFLMAIILFIASFFVFFVNSKRREDFFTNTKYSYAYTAQKYGLWPETVLDMCYSVFGQPSPDISQYIGLEGKVDTMPRTDSITQRVYHPQILNIDFVALMAQTSSGIIKDMHAYFESRQPTFENDYTGVFKGKNLIFITLESFSGKVIDPEFTPVLYKMYTEGFCFENFYASAWGGSTATGEYSNITGNFYNSANCLKMSSDTLSHSALGNMFCLAGYETYAYHNHTYTYYGRDKSHPNFGYQFKGIGNGLESTDNAWPNSDLEMAQTTAAEYINQYLSDGRQKPFHTYYLSVSGHGSYDWDSNSMSKRHRDDLPAKYDSCSDGVRAYLACQYEAELMLQELIKQLEQAGILNDTVFAICCDHYPYGLSDAELSELYGLNQSNLRNNPELYRNAFILWSESMEEPIRVTASCSSIDIAPTLYNLFGLSYDSRLISGTDILSDAEHIAILNTESTYWNWISDKGIYHSSSKEFIPALGVDMGEEQNEYVNITNKRITGIRDAAFLILEKDYYRYVFSDN